MKRVQSNDRPAGACLLSPVRLVVAQGPGTAAGDILDARHVAARVVLEAHRAGIPPLIGSRGVGDTRQAVEAAVDVCQIIGDRG